MSIHVQLERFEGPLGLLLHLIREQEMDIFNINIHQITRQYLEYIKTMRRLDLEVAGEFVAMAATLIHIKSRMLLPQYNEEGEEIEQEDPRKELVQKLLEYKKIKELAVELYKLPLLGRDVFRRGERAEIESLEEGELILEENPLYSLIASYRFAMKNMKKTVHRVAAQMLSIGERIMQMKDMFIPGRRMVFNDLITEREPGSSQVLLTFLSLLELAKMGFISVFQTETFADIHIEAKRTIDRDVISQVENYESVNAEQKADAIMADAQMSLDEAEGVLPDDEAGDETVVQESFADAASDDEIFAEEQRMAAEDGMPVETAPVAQQVAADVSVETFVEEQFELPPAPEVGVAMEADVALEHEIQELAATEAMIEHAAEPTVDEMPADAVLANVVAAESVHTDQSGEQSVHTDCFPNLADAITEKSTVTPTETQPEQVAATPELPPNQDSEPGAEL